MQSIPISIPGKESVPIAAYLDGPPQSRRLVVFLNGMVAPQTSWHPIISSIRAAQPDGAFSMLTYDRFGQGQTRERDPTPADPEFGSDLDEIVRNLAAIVQHLAPEAELVLIGNSIGCAIARRYTAQTPGRVAGIILLDSIMANSDFADDIYPDPESPDLPDTVNKMDLSKAREITRRLFSPDIPNAQGFDRRNMRLLLPRADDPVLKGIDGPPLIIIAAHDPEYFIQDSLEKIGMPVEMTRAYMQPAWERYNEGLRKIGKAGEVKVVDGAGHFIQLDKPGFVVEEVVEMLTRLGW